MPLYDDEGNEVAGAKTAEEIQADIAAATAAARTEAEKGTADKIAQLQKDLDTAKAAAAAGTGEKTPEQKAAEDKVIADKQALVDAAKGAAINVVYDTYKNEQITKMSGGDKKLEEAIRAKLTTITGNETNHEEINAKLRSAYVLATDSMGVKPDTNVLHQNFGGGGGSGRPRVNDNNSASAELIQMGSRVGLTKEDFDKFEHLNGDARLLNR